MATLQGYGLEENWAEVKSSSDPAVAASLSPCPAISSPWLLSPSSVMGAGKAKSTSNSRSGGSGRRGAGRCSSATRGVSKEAKRSSSSGMSEGRGVEARAMYRGVRMRSWGKWVSEIRQPKKRSRIWLGSYSTPEAAAKAYDMALYCLRGPLAALNFPSLIPNHDPPPDLSPRSVQMAAARAAQAHPFFTASSTSDDDASLHISISPDTSAATSQSDLTTSPRSASHFLNADTSPPAALYQDITCSSAGDFSQWTADTSTAHLHFSKCKVATSATFGESLSQSKALHKCHLNTSRLDQLKVATSASGEKSASKKVPRRRERGRVFNLNEEAPPESSSDEDNLDEDFSKNKLKCE